MGKKIVKIIFVILIVLNIFVTTANAVSLDDILNKGKDFIKKGDVLYEENVYSLSESISGILQTVSIVAALIMIMILGVKYITGSIEEQAKVKETMIPFIIGSFVAFGAFSIWHITIEILNDLKI